MMHPLDAPTILVVDDEQGILDAYRDCLAPRAERRAASARFAASASAASRIVARPMEYRLLEALSGERAIALVSAERDAGRRIACGFFDMRMPSGLDGLETLRQVRALDPQMLCTIVTADANRSLEEIGAVFEPGAEDEWDYMAKPFTSPEIVHKARCMVSSWYRRREQEAHMRALSALVAGTRRGPDEAGVTADLTQVALTVLLRMAGSDTGVVLRVEREPDASPVPLPDTAVNADLPPDEVVRRAAHHGVAAYAGWLAAALPEPWPRRVVTCRGNSVREPLLAEIGTLLRASVSGVWENDRLWVQLQRRSHNLEEALRELEATHSTLVERERLAAIGQIAASVAHEVNNPLTWTIGGQTSATQLVRELKTTVEAARRDATALALEPVTRISQQLDEVLHEMGDGLGRISTIVRDMRRTARADEETPQPVTLDETVRSALRLVAGTLQRTADVELALGSSAIVRGHEGRLVQVFSNLLSNAAQAIGEGRPGGRGHVRIESGEDARDGWVVVEDDGCGIPPEAVNRIFEPFYTTKQRGSGSGLGLSITREIVERYGGTITVESTVGQGTRFRVALPLYDFAAGAGTSAGPEPRGGRAAEDTTAARAPARRPSVLLVDDEQKVLAALTRTLRGRCEVTAISSASMALDQIAAGQRYDVIFCDLVMPDMDGGTFYRALSATAPEQAERFVLITGGACTPATSAFLENFEGPVMDKPLDVDAVVRRATGGPPGEDPRRAA